MSRGITDLEKERTQVASLQKLLETKDAYIQTLESRIADLEAEKESLYKEAAEGIKKGWQLEDLQRMIFGRRSERFVPVSPVNAATTQLTLGKDFEPLADEVVDPALPLLTLQQPGRW